MTQKVIVNGAQGKMGCLVVSTLKQHADFDVVAALDHDDDLANSIQSTKPDIVVDFTNAKHAASNTQIIIDHHIHPVIGTSGLQLEQIQQFQAQAASEQLGGIIVPNFSIGAVLMMQYAKDAAKYFDHVEIIETHHEQKLDAPSGTAKKTAQLIQTERESTQANDSNPARGDHSDGVPIHSVRLPGRVAHQQVIFGGTGETLTIQNDCIDRSAYMAGVVLACQKVAALQHLAYGLEEIL